MAPFVAPALRSMPRPLADLVSVAMKPALAAQGFAGREVLSLWSEIVGERLAARSRPIRISWPRRGLGDDETARPAPATLVVLVEGAFAPELQHAAPVILARVNGYLGWSAVGRIVLKQGPVEPRPPARDRWTGPAAGAEGVRARVAAASAKVETEAVRDALTRLGVAVLSRQGREACQR